MPQTADLDSIRQCAQEASVCPPPPHDVHGFIALTDDTITIAIVGGSFAPIRQYFQPKKKAYIERHQQAWRWGGQKD